MPQLKTRKSSTLHSRRDRKHRFSLRVLLLLLLLLPPLPLLCVLFLLRAQLRALLRLRAPRTACARALGER